MNGSIDKESKNINLLASLWNKNNFHGKSIFTFDMNPDSFSNHFFMFNKILQSN